MILHLRTRFNSKLSTQKMTGLAAEAAPGKSKSSGMPGTKENQTRQRFMHPGEPKPQTGLAPEKIKTTDKPSTLKNQN